MIGQASALQGIASRSVAEERAAALATAEFRSATAEILASQPPFYARITIHTVAAMVVTGLVLASVLPVDRVVSARGRVMSEAPKIVVQPLETSIIRSINVREGQIVHAGDVLATLDPTFSTADVATLSRRIASLSAQIDRLKAEMTGEEYNPVPGEVFSDLQKRIFESRKAELAATLATYDEKIASTQATHDQSDREIKFFSDRLKLLSEIEDMKQQLMTSKVGSKADFIAAADARIEIERNLAEAQGRLASSTHELDALAAQRRTFIEKRKSDSATEAVTQQGALDEARELLAKADKRRDLIEMKAVSDAVVLQVGDISVGAVAETAKKMFLLVPLDAPLNVQAEINSADQGFVHVGQRVELKLDAWPYAQHGTAEGVVQSISGDSFSVDEKAGVAGQSIYIANIDITETDLHNVGPDFRLVPGMPLSADIVVGSRTLMSYLVGRAVPIMTEGMREP